MLYRLRKKLSDESLPTERAVVRFGIIADIHANLEALTVALETLEQESVDQIICLGDVVGYGPNPCECLDIIIKQGIPTIRGNHERYLLGEATDSLKDDTLKITEWTRQQLSDIHHRFVESMPNKMQHQAGFLITHGSPRNRDEYILKITAFIENLKLLEAKYPDINVCFHGHSHLPSVVGRGHIVQSIKEDKNVKLEEDRVYLINPGSVGQPRDGSPLSSFGIYDDEDEVFRFLRREYDVEKTQKKIMEVGLAPRFAERLATGT